MPSIRSIFASARSALGRLWGASRSEPQPETRLRASYDSARPGTLDNHWQYADRLDADSAHSREVRQTLISRSRYESESNGYYAGMHQTHATAVTGIGPRLRMQTKSRGFNSAVERDWEDWAREVQLRRKLWCMELVCKKDGESFAILQNNPALRHRIKLDFALIEAEQCQTPYLPAGVVGRIDGIYSDSFGNIIAYDILPVHPGSSMHFAMMTPDVVPARNVLHLFAMLRPGQHRGVPACSSTLNVGASSRRFREAVVSAAEIAANHTSVLYSELLPNGDDTAVDLQAMTSVPVATGMQTVLPRGWRQDSFKSDQPKTGYSEFNKSQVSESARPLGMPHSIAACDASDANFSSLKTNHLTYYAQVGVDRADMDDLALERLFREWWIERQLLSGATLEEAINRPLPPHSFVWPVQPSADRQADATAEDTKLRNGTLTPSRACSDAGLDYEDELTQAAADFGVSVDEMRKVLLHTYFPAAAAALAKPAPQPDAIDPDPADDTELELVNDDETIIA